MIEDLSGNNLNRDETVIVPLDQQTEARTPQKVGNAVLRTGRRIGEMDIYPPLRLVHTADTKISAVADNSVT